MSKFFCLFIFVVAIACSQVKQTQSFRPLPSAIPAVHITGDTGKADLKISKLAVDVHVIGNIAVTTFDVTFYNTYDRILEGELDFPLADGQTIVRYALDMNGSLREGVVVEKAKARVAYENTVRQNIDPGLVEKTAGNNFRTRLYPIPARGYKRVVIGIEQKLETVADKLLYQLPLEAVQAIDTVSINAVVMHGDKPQMETTSFDGFNFKNSETGYEADYTKTAFSGKQVLAFSLPFEEEIINGYTETVEGKTYFFATGRLDAVAEPKQKPSAIGVLWDVSASADKRNREKDVELLQAYLTSSGNVKVLLIPFNITPQAPQAFSVSGNASALITRLKNLTYDGGTQLGALNLAAYNADEFLLFSDGLSTFGKKEITLSNKPVITINSSPSADYSYLKFIAQQSGGAFIDLVKTDVAKAAAQIANTSLGAMSVIIKNGAVQSLVTSVDAATNSFSVAGIINSDEAVLDVPFGVGATAQIIKTVSLKKEESKAEGVARIWASMQINDLDLQFEKNKEQITALGKQFSIVTQNTSLLVLDRVEDYVEHEITPPVELQKEYYALLKEKHREDVSAKDHAMNEAVQAMEDLKNWWNTSFTGRKKKQNASEVVISSQNQEGLVMADSTIVYNFSTNGTMRQAERNNAIPPPSSTIVQGETMNNTLNGRAPGLVSQTDADGVSDKLDDAYKSSASEIKIYEWKSDATYLKTLDEAGAQNAFASYLELKKQYSSQPSFFFDVARWFYDKGQKEMAVLILSNVAEMKLESPELLRMMAYQLLDMQEKELAVLTFKDILGLREEEPQAYRDLALALNEAGNYKEAVDYLYQVITAVWDERFYGIKGIALNEMNSIISAHKTEVNTANIDARLIYAMPVDVRITIDWNTNDSDIDLWVTDPGKEKCFYSNTQTSSGGHISNDMTQGYGPEEFAVKKGVKGGYIIEANLYGDRRQTIGGPITIRADLYTDFGKPTQQRKSINFRVTDNKEVVKIGELKFS